MFKKAVSLLLVSSSIDASLFAMGQEIGEEPVEVTAAEAPAEEPEEEPLSPFQLK